MEITEELSSIYNEITMYNGKINQLKHKAKNLENDILLYVQKLSKSILDLTDKSLNIIDPQYLSVSGIRKKRFGEDEDTFFSRGYYVYCSILDEYLKKTICISVENYLKLISKNYGCFRPTAAIFKSGKWHTVIAFQIDFGDTLDSVALSVNKETETTIHVTLNKTEISNVTGRAFNGSIHELILDKSDLNKFLTELHSGKESSVIKQRKAPTSPY